MSGDSGFQLFDDAATAYDRETRVFMLPLAQALLEVAAPPSGAHVLDLACGTGITARLAAERVGPEGRVVGADINPGMIAVARAAAPTMPAIEWHVASAEDLPFDDDAFDAVVVQQGAQFFPDLGAALRETRRVCRPGGSVTATTWTPVDTSPYMQAQYDALCEVLDPTAMVSFGAAFRLGRDELAGAWTDAGLMDVRVEERSPSVTLPPLDGYVQRHLAATPWGVPFAAASADDQRRVIDRMTAALADHTAGGVVTVPFSTWVVTGTV